MRAENGEKKSVPTIISIVAVLDQIRSYPLLEVASSLGFDSFPNFGQREGYLDPLG
jgi:hypothetical protein